MPQQATVLTGEGITFFHIAAQMSAIKLEGIGLRHSSGRSVLAHCKRIYNLKGSREKVLDAMQAMKDELMKRRMEGLS